MCVAAAVATGCVWHAFRVTEISDFRRIDGGRCADIFEFDVGRVLKLTLNGCRAGLIVDAGVRVPGIFGKSVGGRFGVVMERIDGETLWERVAQRPGDAKSQTARRPIEVGDSFVDALGLMAERIAQVSFVEADLVGRAISVIESRSRGPNLLHGDLHPGNVMVRPSGEHFPRRGQPVERLPHRASEHVIAEATSYIDVYGDLPISTTRAVERTQLPVSVRAQARRVVSAACRSVCRPAALCPKWVGPIFELPAQSWATHWGMDETGERNLGWNAMKLAPMLPIHDRAGSPREGAGGDHPKLYGRRRDRPVSAMKTGSRSASRRGCRIHIVTTKTIPGGLIQYHSWLRSARRR